MSAKLTVIFFILICFEIGAVLVCIPWFQYWTDNQFLMIAAEKLHSPGIIRFMMNGYVRGAVTGLGLFNIILGIWEWANFKQTVRAFQTESGTDDNGSRSSGPPALSNN